MPDDGDSQYRDPAAAPEKPEMLAADLVGAVVHAQEEGASDPAALRRGAAAAARLSRLAAELPLSRTDLLQMAGTMLLRCYDLSGEVADLAAGRNRLMAAASASASASDDPLILAQLGLAWRSTYRHTEDPADLDRAIAADEAAVAAVRPGAAHHPQPLAGLAASLRARYLLTGDVELLDRAISLDEENLRRLAGDDAGSRSVLLHGLANAFAMRFERHGDVDDLRLLIAAREEVLASSDLADADRAYVLNALANAYSLRWSAARDGADLNRALSCRRPRSRLAGLIGSAGPGSCVIARSSCATDSRSGGTSPTSTRRSSSTVARSSCADRAAATGCSAPRAWASATRRGTQPRATWATSNAPSSCGSGWPRAPRGRRRRRPHGT